MHTRLTAVLAVAAAVIVCTFTTNSRAQVVKQLTHTAGTGVAVTPAMDDAGDYVFAISNTQQFGGNPDAVHQIVRFDAATGLGELLTAFPDGVVDGGHYRLDVDDDGEWLAFVSSGDLTGQNHDRGEELFVMRSDGTGLAQVTNDPAVNSGSVYYLAISGDGSRIAFVSYTDPLGTNPSHVQNLFAVNRDGTGLVQLTQETDDYAYFLGFSISDDGQRIAFSFNGDLTGGNADLSQEIFTIESDGSNLNQITTAAYADFVSYPHVSGPGSKIVFQSNWNLAGGNPDFLSEVYLVDWDGTNLQQLTSSAYESGLPTITDDETTVAFLSEQNLGSQNADHNHEVWKIQSNGTGLTLVTDTTGPYGVLYPRVSGDGSRVTYMFYTQQGLGGYPHADGWDLRVLETGGGNHHVLSDVNQDVNLAAELTADGTRAVFLSEHDVLGGDPDGSGEIYRVEADGSGLAQVTNVSAGRVFFPSVAADRTTIVFSAAADPLGTNADMSEEIFRIQADGSGLAQLTSSPTGASQVPMISANGAVVVFQSTADLTGSNADGSMEVFKIAANGTGLLQLTSGAAATSNLAPRVDDIGTWVAYSTGVHIWRIQTNGTGAQRLTPAGQADVSRPDISGSGERIVWSSNSLAGGANPERNDEIFVYDTTTASRIQLTSTDSHPSLSPRLSRDGTWVYFHSFAEFHEDDPDYPFDVQRIRADGTGTVERVGALRIPNVGNQRGVAVDYDGDRAVLAAPGDWAGTNPDRSSEVFLFDRSAPTSITIGKASPTLVSWIPESGPIRYDVIRGDVANLQDGGGGTVDLGAVVCLEDDSPDADTEGFEDAVDPAVGQAYFFLYRGSVGLDVGPGSFGTAKDGRVRVAGSGNCAS